MIALLAAAMLMQADVPAEAPIDPPAGGGLAAYRKAGELVSLADGRLINLRCTGEGGPTVILEAGAAAYSPAWIGVQAEAAAKARARVCAYDRAGLGFSDAAPGSRDIAASVADLDGLIAKVKIETPVVLVGHSLGGLTARLYAARHRDKVAGMVLVDSSVEGFDPRLEEIVPGSAAQWKGLMAGLEQCTKAAFAGKLPPACMPEPMVAAPAELAPFVREQLKRPAHYRSAANELINATRSEDLVAKSDRDLGAMPLVVLTAGANNLAGADATPEQTAAAKAMWAKMHAEVAARSTRGSARVIEGADHFMMRDKPADVVAAIVEVVEAVRAGPQG